MKKKFCTGEATKLSNTQEPRRPDGLALRHTLDRQEGLSLKHGSSNARNPTEMRVREARRAHARGWALTPLQGKVPILMGWQDAPKPDLKTVKNLAKRGNVGLRTGKVSGIVVIDDDTGDGSGVRGLDLPTTPTVITSGDKRHYYYRYPKGGLGNSAGRLAPKVDVKGDGGQVVYPGSIHPETEKCYRWAPGLSPDDVPLADLPEHLLARLRMDLSRKRINDHDPQLPVAAARRKRSVRYAKGALRRAADSVAAATDGERNETLNRMAFSMGRFLGAGILDRAEVESELSKAASSAGLQAGEVQATLQSGLNAGEREPREVLPLLSKLNARDTDTNHITRPGDGDDPPDRPVIVVRGGDLPDIVDQAEAAILADDGRPIYQRSSMLVRTVRTKRPTAQAGIKRAPHALVIVPVNEPYLIERFTKAADFKRFDARTGNLKPIDCPKKVATTYLSREGDWKVPHLTGVIESPTIRLDGSILDTAGYDSVTGIYFGPGKTKFPTVPSQPTLEEAKRALSTIGEVIKDFPFVAPCDRSVALAAFLTAPIRRSIRTSPLFAFRAPARGSGKSLLADCISLMATGRVASAMSQGKSEEEDKKRMLALLLEGEPMACIDNIERPVGGAALCTILTQELWKERILGVNKVATVSTSMMWMATGNNISFEGDITSRVLPCDIDAKCERPEERKFKGDLRSYVRKHRGQLVSAALTVIRAYQVAGRPDQGLSVFGRFEEWSEWVRSALVWCDEADPCKGRERLHSQDPISLQLRAVLIAWRNAIAGDVVTVAEVIRLERRDKGEEPSALYQALAEVAGERNDAINPQRLGKWLSANARRVEAGLRLERMGTHQGVARWKVVEAPKGGVVGLVGSFLPTQENCQESDTYIKRAEKHPTKPTIPTGPERMAIANGRSNAQRQKVADCEARVSKVHFSPATGRARISGIIGWASCLVDDTLRLEVLPVHRLRKGHWQVGFPARMDRGGPDHHVWLDDDRVRREIEQQVIDALRTKGVLK